MSRYIRYQGAILRDDHILLIKHCEHASGRSYWLLPGGGRESGETEEACIRREMREETHLEVSVDRLLLEETVNSRQGYQCYKTYLCWAESGEAHPGYEPEESASSIYAIDEVGWFDLRVPEEWDEKVKTDPITYPLLQRVRAALEYPVVDFNGDCNFQLTEYLVNYPDKLIFIKK